MALFHHIGHHTKKAALSVHGFLVGLLAGTNVGNAVGSLAGAGIGALLAVTGVISGGLVPALIAGVAFGAMVGALAGGAVGSLLGATHDRRAHDAEEPPLQIAPRASLTPAQSPALEQEAQQNIPSQESEKNWAASVGGPKEKVAPAHYRTQEENVSFRNRVSQDRLQQAIDQQNGAASR